jgi:hypothetical protein
MSCFFHFFKSLFLKYQSCLISSNSFWNIDILYQILVNKCKFRLQRIVQTKEKYTGFGEIQTLFWHIKQKFVESVNKSPLFKGVLSLFFLDSWYFFFKIVKIISRYLDSQNSWFLTRNVKSEMCIFDSCLAPRLWIKNTLILVPTYQYLSCFTI